jgi:hypothetical protein
MSRPEDVDMDDWYTEDSELESELCEHGYPEGRGCPECEFWTYVDFMYDWSRDK